ncbi:MAG: ribosomal RNA small subunit methyltransferase H [Candidatus Puniceispirillum sp.]|nr:ribosomal RNA small subunit methyltransferase H [Candidatus Pelagibacter sp.]MBA4283040.1 ribosomal RNA small subunit methyltransferase H [Candidatus Puniceispirillum sp.]
MGHYPVMLPEVLEHLNIQDGGHYLDATFGGGGYTQSILNEKLCTVSAVDRDEDAQKRSKELSEVYKERFHFYLNNFSEIGNFLQHGTFDGIVFDFGVSSFQLDTAERGFSFRLDGPLDMRMSKESPVSAYDVVNGFSKDNLADIIYHYGDEPLSRKIASAIVRSRDTKKIETTSELAEIIRAVSPRRRDHDPATLTFQALRIYVNDELSEIDKGVRSAINLLRPGGRLVVVSFHSLEDRICKEIFKHSSFQSGHTKLKQVTKKAIPPSKTEIRQNVRSRSARLRCIELIKEPYV